jgi:anti-sigma-K factor RskA
MTGAEDNKDVLAGEYVLGLLPADEAEAVRRAALTDPALRDAIAAWRDHLQPLAATVAPEKPSPFLWSRIEAGMQDRQSNVPAAAEPAASSPSRGPWRGVAIVSLFLAACLAAFVVWREPVFQRAPGPGFAAVALLTAPNSLAPSLRLQILQSGEAVAVPLQLLPAQEGRVMGLWAWPSGKPAPVYLGPIRPNGGAAPFPYAPREGTPVMITSEPENLRGAPATPGPTLYAGLLVAAR